MDRTCAVDGCEITNRLRRGLCNSHYKAWLLYGDPTVRRSNKGVSPEKRYWQKVDKTETCWLWTGAKSSTGYGHIQVDGKTVLAHRFGFELANGPIAPGAVLDHLCRVRHCVNPEHLEVVTQRANILRGEGLAAANASKTHCKRGHPYEGDNLRVDAVGRGCRTCDRERQRRVRAAAKEQRRQGPERQAG